MVFHINNAINADGNVEINRPNDQVVVNADITAAGRIDITARDIILNAVQLRAAEFNFNAAENTYINGAEIQRIQDPVIQAMANA